jgi:molecular chaperone GrpE
MDKEHEIPIKVVDRRWWANPDAVAATADPEAARSRKPTYVEELEQKLAEREKEAQEYLAKYRKAASEFDEARLRLKREISKDVERARREVLVEFLDVVDNLDRAIDAARASSSSSDALIEGVEMVRRQVLAKLESFGVTRIEADAQRFDPNLHEAMARVPAVSPDQDGMVVGVVRQGYRIGNEVLRPAGVAVATAGVTP